MVDVVHPALRATAISISIMTMVQNLCGIAVGPVLAGWLSDVYELTTALAAIPLLCIGAAGLYCYGARSYERDRDTVATPPAASAVRPHPHLGQP